MAVAIVLIALAKTSASPSGSLPRSLYDRLSALHLINGAIRETVALQREATEPRNEKETASRGAELIELLEAKGENDEAQGVVSRECPAGDPPDAPDQPNFQPPGLETSSWEGESEWETPPISRSIEEERTVPSPQVVPSKAIRINTTQRVCISRVRDIEPRDIDRKATSQVTSNAGLAKPIPRQVSPAPRKPTAPTTKPPTFARSTLMTPPSQGKTVSPQRTELSKMSTALATAVGKTSSATPSSQRGDLNRQVGRNPKGVTAPQPIQVTPASPASALKTSNARIASARPGSTIKPRPQVALKKRIGTVVESGYERTGPLPAQRRTRSQAVRHVQAPWDVNRRLSEDGISCPYHHQISDRPLSATLPPEPVYPADDQPPDVDYPPRGQTKSLKSLTNETVTMNFRDVEIADIVRLLASKASLNVVSRNQITGRTMVNFENLPVGTAIETILLTNDYGYAARDGVLWIFKEGNSR